ncbi:MAG: SMC-Scp complex subunit ScpB [Paracoccaceae bacterium]
MPEAVGDDALESLFDAPPIPEQERMVEALLFASAEPMSVAELAQRMPQGSEPAEALERLQKRYEGRGVRVVRIGEAWAFRTAPDLGFLMSREVVERRRLSRAAIETLAIIAYHQPVTRTEIEEIRGVSVSRGTIDQLLELNWIRLGRRRMTPGRPVTFVVTPVFLDTFGLESAKDLPGIKELREAGLLDNRPSPGGAFADTGEEGGEEDEIADMFDDELPGETDP